MTRAQLVANIFAKRSYLCVGLDTDSTKLPDHLREQPNAIFQFNKAIIDATKDHCVAYKINTAFYEAAGVKGWEAMEQTADYIPATHFKIADAKRGDIGNTASQYAKAFFETMQFDALTVAPYMGADSVRPFLEYTDKWTILLGLTSNKGAEDFELQKISRSAGGHTGATVAAVEEEFLYERVIKKGLDWGTDKNLMFVIGATQQDAIFRIRSIAPNHFFLVPGVGAQGGSLKEISQSALLPDGGLLVNASRSVIYAGEGEDFAVEAAAIAHQYAYEMDLYL